MDILKMADAEVSKIMWIAIVVALAAAIFIIAKPGITKLATDVFAKVTEVVSGTTVSTAGFITGLLG